MRIVLIVTGVFALVGRKLLVTVAFFAFCLVGIGFMLNTISRPYRNIKALWLAFKVWCLTREIRALKRRVEAQGRLNASSGV